MVELSTSNKVLLGLLLAVLGTWGMRETFHTSTLKTQEQLEQAVRTARQEDSVKLSQALIEKGEAYKQISTLTSKLSTATKTSGTKVTSPDGTVTENWQAEQQLQDWTEAMSSIQDQLTQTEKQLETTKDTVNTQTQTISTLQSTIMQKELDYTKMAKRITVLAGYGLGAGTWQERLKVQVLGHFGVLSAGVSASPAAALEQVSNPDPTAWAGKTDATAWVGWSF